MDIVDDGTGNLTDGAHRSVDLVGPKPLLFMTGVILGWRA